MKKVFFMIALILVACIPMTSLSSVSALEISSSNAVVRANIDEFLSMGAVNREAYTTGELRSAGYLSNKMSECGLNHFVGENYIQSFGSDDKKSQNVVGIKTSTVSDKIVILGAHYDNYKNCGGGVYDNVSGVVSVLALMKALKDVNLPYSVVYVFYGAEELGMLGSKYFVNNISVLARKNIILSCNFDSIGVGEHNYYYCGDNMNQHSVLFANNEYGVEKYSAYPRANYLVKVGDSDYGHIALYSDNSTYINENIRSVNFFSGNADEVYLGFKESKDNENIHHTIDDNLNNILDLYPDFLRNINSVVALTFNVMTQPDFYTQLENMKSGINLNFFNDKLIVFFTGIVGLLFLNKYLTQKINNFKREKD